MTNLLSSLELRQFHKKIVSKTKSILKKFRINNIWFRRWAQLEASVRQVRLIGKWKILCRSSRISKKSIISIWRGTMIEKSSLVSTIAWDWITWLNNSSKIVMEILWSRILSEFQLLDSKTISTALKTNSTKWCTMSQFKVQWHKQCTLQTKSI